MRKRNGLVFASAVMLTLGILSMVPASVHWASTWRDRNISLPGVSVQNFFMLMGFYSLGLELTGLIILWTAYRRRERYAWCTMLILTVFLVFPLNGLSLLLELHAHIQTWSNLVHGVRSGNSYSIAKLLGACTVLWMALGLILPLREFFQNASSQPQREAAAKSCQAPSVPTAPTTQAGTTT